MPMLLTMHAKNATTSESITISDEIANLISGQLENLNTSLPKRYLEAKDSKGNVLLIEVSEYRYIHLTEKRTI